MPEDRQYHQEQAHPDQNMLPVSDLLLSACNVNLWTALPPDTFVTETVKFAYLS